MSKITLTPNASGTGTFTVASPNSNTNRTLTLPDEAGELLINGTTSNVGIGTSSPTTKLQSKGGSISTPTNNAGLIANASASFVVEHGNDYGIYTGYVNSTNDAVGIAATRTLGGALPLSLQPFGGNVGIGLSTNIASKLHVNSELSLGPDNNNRMIVGSTSGGVGSIGTIEGGTASFDTMTFKGGNVGIGTSSPTGPLSVQSNTNATAIKIIGRSDDISELDFMENDNSTILTRLQSRPTYFGIQTKQTIPIIFSTNGSERMRIDSSGNLLVGTTSSNIIVDGVDGFKYFASGTLQLNNGSATTAEIARYGTDGAVIKFYKGSTEVGNISLTGSSTAYNTSSDYRLKTDAQPMTGASARVQALNPVNFEWIADGTRVDGFLAHEAQAIVPEAVTGTKDAMRDEEYEVTPAVYEDVVIPAVLDDEGNELEAERTEQQLVTEAVMGTRSVPDYQGIDQSKLVPLLTAALQEALTEISDLKARVVALEAV